ncbi:hypothetical protein CBR_g45699 [Chara braunii]|uniref:DUF7605 domain-containing protein n=1 Tax=Chara braunii TaxID=69332 RepID=A0A388K3K5_CHABU|nr:hypothetical protein CBR_g45699 [Chara braunii]|eukprot:GBG64644.1 hypothetical protein CBR_g45699 [Chara braunii]
MASPLGAAPVPFRISGSPDDAARWIQATLTNSPEEAATAAEIMRTEKIDCEVLLEEDFSNLCRILKLRSFGAQRKLRLAFQKLFPGGNYGGGPSRFSSGTQDGNGQELRNSQDEHGRSTDERVEQPPQGGSGSSQRNGWPFRSSLEGGLSPREDYQVASTPGAFGGHGTNPTVTLGPGVPRWGSGDGHCWWQKNDVGSGKKSGRQAGRESMVENCTPASQPFSCLIDSSFKGTGSERKCSGASVSGMADLGGKCVGDKDSGLMAKGRNLTNLDRGGGDGGDDKMRRIAAGGAGEFAGASLAGGEIGTGSKGGSDGTRQLQQGGRKDALDQGSGGGGQTHGWASPDFGRMEPKMGPRTPTDSFCLSEPANVSSGDESDSVVAGDMEADSELENQMVKERDHMEDIVSRCSDQLREFEDLLKQESDNLASTIRTEGWLKMCEDLEKQLRIPSTTIGVVGISGAVLAYYLLTRYCIGRIREEWRREVELGLDEVKGDAMSEDMDEGKNHAESERLSAAKLIAVYGKEALRRKGVVADDLMKVNQISQVLDTTLKVCAPSSKELLDNLRKYMSSCRASESDGGEFWPLVRKVHVRYRWPALACGAKLVDLPGTRDSNAARNQVAETYLKKCNVIWVVAEMKRAMSDAESSQLLGDNFRRQVLMDGSYNKIAFICTMIDNMRNDEECEGDISLRVICQAAGISKEEFQSVKAKRVELQKEKTALEKQLQALPCPRAKIQREIKKILREMQNVGMPIAVDNSEGDQAVVTGRMHACCDGRKSHDEVVVGSMTPTSPSMKPLGLPSLRTPTSPTAKVGEKRKLEIVEPSLPLARSMLTGTKGKKKGSGRGRGNGNSAAIQGGQGHDSQRDALLKRLQELRKQAEEQKVERGAQTYDHHRKQILSKINFIQARIDRQSRKIKLWCIIGRNARAKSTIKQSFVDNLGGPDGPHRHKDSLDVPVFCVSAAEALALSRKIGSGQSPSMFKNIQSTGIPEVREYVHRTASEQLRDIPKAAVARLSQFFEGVCAYLCDAGSNDNALCERVQLLYKKHEEEMQLEITRVIEETHQKIDALFETQIEKELQNGVRAAEADALEVAQGWHKRLLCITYKAACKPGRDGVFIGSNRVGPIDFNEDLAKPILDNLTIPWDQVMNDAMFTLLAETRKQLLDILGMFFQDAKEALCEEGISDHRISRVEDQARTALENLIRCHMDETLQYIRAEQKDISRELVPEVQSRMKPVYEKVVKEAGKDSYKRMKQIMSNFISQEKGNLFQKAAEVMLKKLKHLVSEVKVDLDRLQDSIPTALAGHYGCFFDRPVTSFDKRKRDKAIMRVRAIAESISQICTDADVKVDFRGKSLDFPASRKMSGCTSGGDLTKKQSGRNPSAGPLSGRNEIPSNAKGFPASEGLHTKRTVSDLGKELLEAVMADTNRRSAARPGGSSRSVSVIAARAADWPSPSFNRSRAVAKVRSSCGLGGIDTTKRTESKQKRAQSSVQHTLHKAEEMRRPMDPPRGLSLSNMKSRRGEEERQPMKSPAPRKGDESNAPLSRKQQRNVPARIMTHSHRRDLPGPSKEPQRGGTILEATPPLRPSQAVPSPKPSDKEKRPRKEKREKREKKQPVSQQPPPPPSKKRKLAKEDNPSPIVLSQRRDNPAPEAVGPKAKAGHKKRLIPNIAPVAGSKMQIQNRVIKKFAHGKRHKHNDEGQELCLRTPSKPVLKTVTTYFGTTLSGKRQPSSDREDDDDDDDDDDTSSDDSDKSTSSGTGKDQPAKNGKEKDEEENEEEAEEEEEEEKEEEANRRKRAKRGSNQDKVATKALKGKNPVKGADKKLRQSRRKKQRPAVVEKITSDESEAESDSEDGSDDPSSAKASGSDAPKKAGSDVNSAGSGDDEDEEPESDESPKVKKAKRAPKKRQQRKSKKGRRAHVKACKMGDDDVRDVEPGSEESEKESSGENSCDSVRKREPGEDEVDEDESEEDDDEEDDSSSSSSSETEDDSEDEEGEEVNMRSRGRSMFF